jgi:hypothetical protein
LLAFFAFLNKVSSGEMDVPSIIAVPSEDEEDGADKNLLPPPPQAELTKPSIDYALLQLLLLALISVVLVGMLVVMRSYVYNDSSTCRRIEALEHKLDTLLERLARRAMLNAAPIGGQEL